MENLPNPTPGYPGVFVQSQSDTRPRVVLTLAGFLFGVLLCAVVGLFFLYRQTKEERVSIQTNAAQTMLDRYELSLTQHQQLLGQLYTESLIADEAYKKAPPEKRRQILLNNATSFNRSVDSIFTRRWVRTADTIYKNNPTKPPGRYRFRRRR